MTTTFQRRYMWLAAMVASLALMVVSFGFAQVAVAETDNIDPTKNGSLTIHKHEKPETPGIGDGEVISPTPDKPLGGVNFKVTKLNVDITDPKVWQAFDTLTYDGTTVKIKYPDAPSATDVDLGASQEKVTLDDGTAAFTGLQAGAYLVEELEWTKAPDGQFIAEKAEPFFVTIPMKSPTSNAWNYDVHAYPKNSLSTVSKSVDDSNAFNAANEGELITWVVSAQMPANTELTKVEIVDTFDSRIDPASIEVQKVTTNDGGAETDLPEANYTADISVSTATVTLNTPNAANEKEVKVYFTGRLQALTNEHTADDVLATSGVIPNKATVTINDESTETNEVETKWGDVAIFKHSDTDSKPLAGAKFDVYRPNDTGQCDKTNGTKIGSVKTDANGRAYLRLKVGENYCLVETKAPAGFKNLADPVAFNVAEGKFVDTANTEKNFVKVANEKTDYPALPLTGAAGKLVLIIIGASLLALAIGLLIVHKRRKRENQ